MRVVALPQIGYSPKFDTSNQFRACQDETTKPVFSGALKTSPKLIKRATLITAFLTSILPVLAHNATPRVKPADPRPVSSIITWVRTPHSDDSVMKKLHKSSDITTETLTQNELDLSNAIYTLANRTVDVLALFEQEGLYSSPQTRQRAKSLQSQLSELVTQIGELQTTEDTHIETIQSKFKQLLTPLIQANKIIFNTQISETKMLKLALQAAVNSEDSLANSLNKYTKLATYSFGLALGQLNQVREYNFSRYQLLQSAYQSPLGLNEEKLIEFIYD